MRNAAIVDFSVANTSTVLSLLTSALSVYPTNFSPTSTAPSKTYRKVYPRPQRKRSHDNCFQLAVVNCLGATPRHSPCFICRLSTEPVKLVAELLADEDNCRSVVFEFLPEDKLFGDSGFNAVGVFRTFVFKRIGHVFEAI